MREKAEREPQSPRKGKRSTAARKALSKFRNGNGKLSEMEKDDSDVAPAKLAKTDAATRPAYPSMTTIDKLLRKKGHEYIELKDSAERNLFIAKLKENEEKRLRDLGDALAGHPIFEGDDGADNDTRTRTQDINAAANGSSSTVSESSVSSVANAAASTGATLTHYDPKTLHIVSEKRCAWVAALTPKLNGQMASAQAAYVLVKSCSAEPPKILSVPRVERLSWVPFETLFNPLAQVDLLLATWLGVPLPNPKKPAGDWESDEYFVKQRLRGVNPCGLKAASREVLLKFNISTAPDDNHYFVCDYDILVPFSKKLADQHDAHGYVPSPICLFKLSGGVIEPVAIVLDQSIENFQIVRADNSAKWKYAKMCVRAADWNVHELGSHLTLSHIVTEVACVVTKSTLPKEHPIFQLLLPHFYRTLLLNADARAKLIPDYIASQLSAFNATQCFALCATIFRSWHFEANYVPADLDRRGVAGLQHSVYPFATTARQAWDAIKVYVASFLMYLTQVGDTNLFDDYYLSEWCTSMQKALPGFPAIVSVDQLADALTMIIYTATHQHSAVNYFQSTYMRYWPAAPGFIPEPPPRDIANTSEERWLELLKEAISPPDSPHGKMIPSIQTALVDMLSFEPSEKHRLTQFDLTNTAPAAQYVKFQPLRKELTFLQTQLTSHFGPPSRTREDEPGRVSYKSLAQSILI
eukprot:Opistho-2@18823